MSRAQHIKEVLDHHFQVEIEIAVATPEAAQWRGLIDELGPQAIYGWSWPIEHDAPAILMPYCPEIIDEQTADLDDDELKEYLDVIKWVGQSHILWWFETPDPAARQRRIENEMNVKYRGSLGVWDAVRLSVLDDSDRNVC